MATPLVIDGGHGEGGGQILRTALSLAAISGRGFRLVNIRASRPKPGLAAQHLTSVRAAAALCDAALAGDVPGSATLDFTPRRTARAGEYRFDVAQARQGGSAGAMMLVLQTVLPPLAMAGGESRLWLRGGSHVPWSPSADYVREAWLPTLARMGMRADCTLLRPGWFPIGEGEASARITGGAGVRLAPLRPETRGTARPVRGRALVSRLPLSIAERMRERALRVLADAGLAAEIGAEQHEASGPGAALFLLAEYEAGRGGFTAMGRRGLPAEQVAENAVAELLAYHRSGAHYDAHLADQLLLPAALARGESRFTVERVTRHLLTNAWVLTLFGAAEIAIEGEEGAPGRVHVRPAPGWM